MAQQALEQPQTGGIVGLTPKADDLTFQRSQSFYQRAFRHLRRDYSTQVSALVLLSIILLSLFAPQITHALNVNPETTDPSIRLLPPGTPGHILGTDNLGRDYLARLLYGGGVSLRIGFLGAVLTLTIGVFFGLIAGYFGGLFDDVMNWLITTLNSVPGLYLLILISALFRPGEEALIVVIALTTWTGTTRLIRALTIRTSHQEYILGAQAIGASHWRVIFVHILPHTLPYILLSLSAGIGGVIVAESTLSFLNLGIQPPKATWGNMLSNAQLFFRTGPHMAIISGVMIFITVLCLYTIGDALRDAFDPQTSSNK